MDSGAIFDGIDGDFLDTGQPLPLAGSVCELAEKQRISSMVW